MTTPNKYQREIRPGVIVDVYDVLKAWNVTCPALQHLIKKALQPGARGHKTAAEDLDDIVASAIRARDLQVVGTSANVPTNVEVNVKTVPPIDWNISEVFDKRFPWSNHLIEFPQPSHNRPQPKTFEDAKQ